MQKAADPRIQDLKLSRRFFRHPFLAATTIKKGLRVKQEGGGAEGGEDRTKWALLSWTKARFGGKRHTDGLVWGRCLESGA